MSRKYLFIGGPLDGKRMPAEVRDGQPQQSVWIAQIEKADLDPYPQVTNDAPRARTNHHEYRVHRFGVGLDAFFIYASAHLFPWEVVMALIDGYKQP